MDLNFSTCHIYTTQGGQKLELKNCFIFVKCGRKFQILLAESHYVRKVNSTCVSQSAHAESTIHLCQETIIRSYHLAICFYEVAFSLTYGKRHGKCHGKSQ